MENRVTQPPSVVDIAMMTSSNISVINPSEMKANDIKTEENSTIMDDKHEKSLKDSNKSIVSKSSLKKRLAKSFADDQNELLS